MMMSTQAFRIAQADASLAFYRKKLENLFLKNCRDTSLEMMGRCLMASFLTLTLESSPRDRIYSPMNC